MNAAIRQRYDFKVLTRIARCATRDLSEPEGPSGARSHCHRLKGDVFFGCETAFVRCPARRFNGRNGCEEAVLATLGREPVHDAQAIIGGIQKISAGKP